MGEGLNKIFPHISKELSLEQLAVVPVVITKELLSLCNYVCQRETH
jgi:hypothetical protein